MDFKIDEGVLIPATRGFRSAGHVRLLMRQLKASKVGCSGTVFVKHMQTVAYAARKEGVKVVSRTISHKDPEKEKQKMILVRVWKSDGLSALEINELILKELKS